MTLLSNDVVIVEGLDLGDVEQGEYDLVVMPLRLVDGDGGPARAGSGGVRWPSDGSCSSTSTAR